MPEFFRLEIAETLAELQTSQEVGLTAKDAGSRQTQYGKNSLPVDAGTNWLELIAGQFKELMVIILLIAAAISLFLGDTKDVIVIMAIVILNALLGIYQEYQAERALAALSALQVPLVRVRRDGEIHQISAEDLVPGDIVILQEGDRIPADGRLVETVNLQVDESALTGESVPVDKKVDPLRGEKPIAVADRSNMAFMGTAVNYGRGEMVITQTGLKTELGTIAAMLLQVEQGITPLQRRLNRLGQILAIGAAIVVGVVFLAGILRGIPAQEMFLTAISLAVAAVPEGLPALITISLSLGAARMVRRHALIRRLPAVETLGSVTIICSDKTGTLTKNEMTATTIALPGVDDEIIITGIGYTPEGKFRQPDKGTINFERDTLLKRFVTAITLSTNAYLDQSERNGQVSIVGDTTEGALLVAAQKVGWKREILEKDLPRRAELPFSSERKAMTTLHEIVDPEFRELFLNASFISITKGAPDQLIEWASHETLMGSPNALTPQRRRAWLNQIEEMAQQGLRVLGIAYRPLEAVPAQDTLTPETIERDLHLLGLVGILDPARPEARDAVQTAKSAGIRSIMITGDHALTAEAIARDLGILSDGQRAVTGNQLDTLSDAELLQKIDTTSVFARVSPAHKLRLVRVLQGKSQIVAMTGDGVNDAPALKQADIGVAMGITGTDVSKGAAAMVLTDDNFASIVAAIEEGRIIYDNIRKFIKYLLSSNVGEILVMFVALLAGLKIPLLAIQILWINLVTDGLPAIALGFEPAEPDVMQRKPRPKEESILAGGTGRHIIWVGILIMALTLGGYLYGHTVNGLEPFNQTLGLETFSQADLQTLLRQESLYELIPADWDSMDEQARIDFILPHEAGEQPSEEVNDGLLGAAERIPRTIAFTILAFTQMFEVMAIHAGDKAVFFRVWFKKNQLLLWAVISTFILQLLVIYLPFLQNTFDTSPLNGAELILSFVLGAVVLFGVEIEKYINREFLNKEIA